MSVDTINQAYLFVIFIINGFLIGIFFDIFRILRKSFKTNDFFTYLEDIIFWILSGMLILYSIFVFNNGDIRGYFFLSIIIGVIIYMLIFSKVFIKINVGLIDIMKKIFGFIILPINFIIKLINRIFIKPCCIICINFRKFIKKTCNINKNLEKKKEIEI